VIINNFFYKLQIIFLIIFIHIYFVKMWNSYFAHLYTNTSCLNQKPEFASSLHLFIFKISFFLMTVIQDISRKMIFFLNLLYMIMIIFYYMLNLNKFLIQIFWNQYCWGFFFMTMNNCDNFKQQRRNLLYIYFRITYSLKYW
jgi:hypothetical protein